MQEARRALDVLEQMADASVTTFDAATRARQKDGVRQMADGVRQAMRAAEAELQRLRAERDALAAHVAAHVAAHSQVDEADGLTNAHATECEAKLKGWIREQAGRYACRVLSTGGDCDCPLCLTENLGFVAAQSIHRRKQLAKKLAAADALTDLSWLRPVLAERLTNDVLDEVIDESSHAPHRGQSRYSILRAVILGALCPAARTEEDRQLDRAFSDLMTHHHEEE